MPTWWFRGLEDHAGLSSTHEWYWEIETGPTSIAITSTRRFPTLDECIAHAREHGFCGTVEVPENVEYPALIACEAHERRRAPVRRSESGRANRSAR